MLKSGQKNKRKRAEETSLDTSSVSTVATMKVDIDTEGENEFPLARMFIANYI